MRNSICILRLHDDELELLSPFETQAELTQLEVALHIRFCVDDGLFFSTGLKQQGEFVPVGAVGLSLCILTLSCDDTSAAAAAAAEAAAASAAAASSSSALAPMVRRRREEQRSASSRASIQHLPAALLGARKICRQAQDKELNVYIGEPKRSFAYQMVCRQWLHYRPHGLSLWTTVSPDTLEHGMIQLEAVAILLGGSLDQCARAQDDGANPVAAL